MHIEEIVQKIVPADVNCMKLAQKRFDDLIKPVGSLAQLERMTSRYAGILGVTDKRDLDYPKRDLIVWGGLEDGENLTAIMNAKMPVNVLAAETGAKVHALFVTATTAEEALEEGATLMQELIQDSQLGLLGFGCLAKASDKMVQAAMVGGILMAASLKVPVILDGVATCFAAQKAAVLAPVVKDYLYAGHISAEKGAEEAVAALGLEAPLRLNIPDGAGEGAAICFTLFNAGIKAYKEMETFEEAGVHAEEKEYSLHEQKKKEQGN